MNSTETGHRAALAGKISTVLGTIAPASSGPTLMHEHLLIDARHLESRPDDPEAQAIYKAPYEPTLLGRLVFDGMSNRDNTVMDDIGSAVAEIAHFKKHGGSILDEVTSGGIGRDPKGLAEISRQSGVHVVMGASYYVEAAHPAEVAALDEGQLADKIATDVLVGADGTGIKAGIIGEVGCSWPLSQAEIKVLRASAQAQKRTGASLSIHPGRSEAAPFEICEVLAKAGADLTRTVMCHTERTIFDREKLSALARAGIVIEYDMFGHEFSYYWPAPHISAPNDGGRMDAIGYLVEQGFENQIVLSHDNDVKMWLSQFGGPGYGHILRNIVPRLIKRGIPEAMVQKFLVETPRRLLTIQA
ncbi:phosphotriesterase family protein [Hypericibacter sp.]|uniref:phosphotriesterase family protein n=1 Tax=Hypericibacter sp. TaxID=2705401 RepID=UPI003D6D7101